MHSLRSNEGLALVILSHSKYQEEIFESKVKNLIEEYAGTVVADDTELEATPEHIRTLLAKL